MNKTIIKSMAIAVISAAMLTSCDIESSHNGKLDGFWHLEQVDTLATGGTADKHNGRIFWAVQAKLLNVRSVNGSNGYYLRFDQTSDKLTLHSPCSAMGQSTTEGGNPTVSDPKLLAPYGINNLREEFAKEQLTGSKMVLRSATLRLHFRKF